MKLIFKKGLILSFWLLVWQMASYLTGLELLLASPVHVATTLWGLIKTISFWTIIWNSFVRVTVGFLLAFLFGVVIGALAGMNRLIQEFLEPVVQLMKALPVTAFIILILIWFGSERISAIIAFIVVFPMIYTSVIEGISNVDPKLLEMSDVFKMHFWKKIAYIYLPQVYPYIVTNLRTALGMCWKAAISAEVIGLAKNSIGSQMYYSKLYLMTADLFAWSIMVVVISYIFERIFLFLALLLKNKIESI